MSDTETVLHPGSPASIANGAAPARRMMNRPMAITRGVGIARYTVCRRRSPSAELRVPRLCSISEVTMIKSILTPVLLGFIVAFANTRRPARA